jgi:Xaa-Pro dipeptidase
MKPDPTKLEKAVRSLNERGLDGLIIYSNGSCNILGVKYLHYFAEFKPMGPHNAAVISKDGDVILLVEPEWDAARAKNHSWIKGVRGTTHFMKELAEVMDEFKLTRRVGLVGTREMTEPIYAGINRKADIVIGDSIITEMARKKTDREVEIARKAGRMADAGFKALLNHARIGRKEYELLADLEFAMRSAGADDIFNFMSSGKHNYAMHNPTDRRLCKGDIVIAEITAACEGQFAQLCRTVVLGEPAPLLQEKYDMLLHALDQSMRQVKSGNPASQISVAMNRVISDAGYAKYCYPPYMRARGHGIGVGSIAPGGVIDDETRANLEKDQVVVVHPNQYLPETGYLACGETVLVTETGLERLSETETRLYINEV